jgi:hypothetical protein
MNASAFAGLSVTMVCCVIQRQRGNMMSMQPSSDDPLISPMKDKILEKLESLRSWSRQTLRLRLWRPD